MGTNSKFRTTSSNVLQHSFGRLLAIALGMLTFGCRLPSNHLCPPAGAPTANLFAGLLNGPTPPSPDSVATPMDVIVGPDSDSKVVEEITQLRSQMEKLQSQNRELTEKLDGLSQEKIAAEAKERQELLDMLQKVSAEVGKVKREIGSYREDIADVEVRVQEQQEQTGQMLNEIDSQLDDVLSVSKEPSENQSGETSSTEVSHEK